MSTPTTSLAARPPKRRPQRQDRTPRSARHWLSRAGPDRRGTLLHVSPRRRLPRIPDNCLGTRAAPTAQLAPTPAARWVTSRRPLSESRLLPVRSKTRCCHKARRTQGSENGLEIHPRASRQSSTPQSPIWRRLGRSLLCCADLVSGGTGIVGPKRALPDLRESSSCAVSAASATKRVRPSTRARLLLPAHRGSDPSDGGRRARPAKGFARRGRLREQMRFCYRAEDREAGVQ
jgi:hypothetical protein